MAAVLNKSANAPTNLIALDALGPNGDYRTRNRELITDVAGVVITELSIVPRAVRGAHHQLRNEKPVPLRPNGAAKR